MKKKNSWLSDSINRIAWIDHYRMPEKVEGAIKLDSNENFVLDRNFVAGVAAEAAKQVDLREYPLDQMDELYARLAKYAGVSIKCVAAGSGSDQIIELLLSTLGGRHATVFSPTFSYFINRCKLHGIKVYQVPLEPDFTLDKKAFVKTAKRSDLIYLCSPNNPTGNQIDRQQMIEVMDSLEDKLVLIDEAYVDFADYSLSCDAIKRSNVIVLRTLSKAFGLAGARVGYMVSNRKFVKIFKSIIQSPYPISTLSLAIASGVLADADQVKQTIRSVRSERERVFARLSKIDGIKIFRSDANFIFIEAGKKYQAISKTLNSNGIIVKLLGNITNHKGCMRITIGTPEMNDKYLKCIEQII
ncbi:MAG TPA: histidinol-phosphate transaminase [Nitrososphaera sp.]|jgi:histidinol-phosphate aminotransferase|nr:histidinol-phosphate transaminase [Nitrososphaera sp.]